MRYFMNKRVLLSVAGLGAVCVVWGWAFGFPDLWRPSPETIAAGREIFEHEWQPHDERSPHGDGLGPVFNAKSCVACHFQGGVGGAGPNKHNVLTFEVHPHKGHPTVESGVVHASAVAPELQETQQTVSEVFPVIPGGIRNEGGCPMSFPEVNPVHFTSINTPPLFGVGEINGISDGAIKRARWKRTVSAVGQELSGNFKTTPAGKVREVDGGVGKFGWKGQFASVDEFVAVACAVEMGLTNPLVAQQTPRRHRADESAALDLDQQQFDSLVAFVETLPRPQQVLPESADEQSRVAHGEALFTEVGCADCHPSSIGGVDGVYSDFLLYSLEDDPNGGGGGYGPPVPEPEPWPEDIPIATEWQTPPLWGIADSAPYFHDGASKTLEAAIIRHRGAAKHVTKRYLRLDRTNQAAVIAFLQTLKAPQTAVASADAPQQE